MAEIVIFSLPRECSTIWYAKKGSFFGLKYQMDAEKGMYSVTWWIWSGQRVKIAALPEADVILAIESL